MASATPNWKGTHAILLDTYDATDLLNAPFKVILVKAAKKVTDEAGNLVEIIIPDPEGLMKAVAQCRILHTQKLNGQELKFLRSALGLKSKELANQIAVTPEHMSRLESGDKVLSPQSEMLVRIFTFVSTLRFTPKKEEEAMKVVDHLRGVFGNLSIKACHSIDKDVTLRLVRVPRSSSSGNGTDDGLWDEPTTSKAA